MSSQKTIPRAWSAFIDVIKFAYSPIPSALSFWEVLKLIPYLAAYTIYGYYQIEWYWLLVAVSAILFLVTAVRIQMRFKGKFNELQELYTRGVELRNKYLNPNLDPQEAVEIDEECETWANELYSVVEVSFPNYKTLFRPLRDVPSFYYPKINGCISIKVLQEHDERLERLNKFFEENRSIL